MDWKQIVRSEHKRLREERKMQISNAWKNNRALIQSDTIEHCAWRPESYDRSQFSKGENVGAVFFNEGEITLRVVRKSILPAVDSAPKMFTWLPIPRNIVSEYLRNEGDKPHSGHDDGFSDEVIDANETTDNSNKEDEGNDFMDDETFFIKLVRALIPYQRSGITSSSSQPSENNNESVIVSDTAALDAPEAIIFQSIYDCFPARNTNADRLREKYMRLTKATATCTPNIDEPMKEPLKRDEALASYHKLFCRKCFIYNCPFHSHAGINFVPKLKTGDIEWLKPVDHPCSNACYLLENEARENSFVSRVQSGRKRTFNEDDIPDIVTKPENGSEMWSGSELTMLEALVNVFRDNFCIIAETIRTKTCQEVRKQFKFSELKPPIRRKKIQVKTRGMRTQEFEKVYQPCNHETSCHEDENCLCINCDKFCNCDADCKKRTCMTCNCKAPCTTKSCLCVRYKRECDPDTCGCFSCKNMNIQQCRRLEKKLQVATSGIHGWGVFIDESCQKGEFITEYRGEIITTNEANFRADVYAKEKRTYLFNLNAEYVIDAMEYGSRVRFANFSVTPNCCAKILMVNGDHRIGIFALQNIEAGEELTINYLTDDPTEC